MSGAKDIGSRILTRTNLVAAAGEAAVNGVAVDITALTGNPRTMRSVVAVQFNADSGDSLNVSAIKLQSSADSAFTTPVDRVTAANVVLTGTTGDTNVDYRSQAVLDYDLQNHKAAYPTHKWLRTTATPTRSDTTNTAGAVAAVHIYSGLGSEPQT